MRKIVVLEFLTLDGVMQAPGGPEEDPSESFAFGGWQAPYGDDFMGKVMTEQMARPFDLLLGRKTYDIFASYWPNQTSANPVAAPFNKATKYAVSHNADLDLPWEGTELITGDVVAKIKALKKQKGPMLQIYGSGDLVQTLLKHDLVNELWLKFYPLTIGSGKKLFADGTIPAAFELLDSKVSPNGVIFANYKRSGEVKTGSFV